MYNAGGIRTSKTVDGITTDYHLVGDKVTLETDGTNTIYYTYDASGKLISMNLTNTTYPNGAEFYYIRNAQGDISGLYDSIGTEVVSYTYDTWGKLEGIDGTLANTVGVINPYRYRCYRYDSETGMYYLQSRYYNPEIGRFINADILLSGIGGSVQGCNMFAYCINNPTNLCDPTGKLHYKGGGGSRSFNPIALILYYCKAKSGSKGASSASSNKTIFGASATATSTYDKPKLGATYYNKYTGGYRTGTREIATLESYGNQDSIINAYVTHDIICQSSKAGIIVDRANISIGPNGNIGKRNLSLSCNIVTFEIESEYNEVIIDENGMAYVEYYNWSVGPGTLLAIAVISTSAGFSPVAIPIIQGFAPGFVH